MVISSVPRLLVPCSSASTSVMISGPVGAAGPASRCAAAAGASAIHAHRQVKFPATQFAGSSATPAGPV